MSSLKYSLRKSYLMFKTNDIYLYLKKTKFRRIWLLIQRFHHELNMKFGKRIILHNDLVLKEMFKFIGNKIKITSIMETGTFLGFTTEFLANNFPKIPIYTCEIIEPIYLKAKKSLKKYENIKIFRANSIELLKNLNREELGSRPLFYLDAHGEGECPLEKEIAFISKNFKFAIIIIDDFRTGNILFQYDQYEGKDVSLERVIPNLNKKLKYNLLFPNYDEKVAYKNAYGNLTGYAIIFQGFEEEFKEIIKHEFIKKFFIDKSELLK